MGEHILPDALLRRFAERAAGYDRENRFFQEDFDDLKDAGYLTLPVPKELGGAGFTLAQVCREQRRLGYHAPATALGVNMHLYWVGLAADLWRQGDRSLEWLLREAMAGEMFNAGHSERGNDLPVLLSTSADRGPGDGGLGRRRHVPQERIGAPLPRCALRPLPSGQHLPNPRDRRQDRTRHRSRRAAALGSSQH